MPDRVHDSSRLAIVNVADTAQGVRENELFADRNDVERGGHRFGLPDQRTVFGKLPARTVAATNRRAASLISSSPRRVRTITVDHGTEFHGYKKLEGDTGARFYFATPYHSWERGTSENTNGLLRQYFPKKKSMARVSQNQCSKIAAKLNQRPRKRLKYLTPEECFVFRHTP